VGEKVWALVGPLSPKDKTQLEERLRRVPGPSSHEHQEAPALAPGVARLTANVPRPNSPSLAAISRVARPASPALSARPASPTVSAIPRAESPARPTRLLGNAPTAMPLSPTSKNRPKSMLPSRLGRPRPNFSQVQATRSPLEDNFTPESQPSPEMVSSQPSPSNGVDLRGEFTSRPEVPDNITITISSILSSDPTRSVDALKKVQKILAIGPEAGPSSPTYRELAEHTEGLIETITLQMAHVFDRPDDLIPDENFRLAKHLIQTLNNFCDHAFLAESLTVEILTSLLEELTLRLLETDDSHVKKIKDLSRFINMIILRLFATGRRMSIFR
jgi:cytoskeleton-associated protein 5